MRYIGTIVTRIRFGSRRDRVEHFMTIAFEYRRQPGDQIWHWQEACIQYPRRSFAIQRTKPAGRLCMLCAALGPAS
jgi:hypothetical protein